MKKPIASSNDFPISSGEAMEWSPWGLVEVCNERNQRNAVDGTRLVLFWFFGLFWMPLFSFTHNHFTTQKLTSSSIDTNQNGPGGGIIVPGLIRGRQESF